MFNGFTALPGKAVLCVHASYAVSRHIPRPCSVPLAGNVTPTKAKEEERESPKVQKFAEGSEVHN